MFIKRIKKTLILTLLLIHGVFLSGCTKENDKLCKFVRNDDLKQEFSLVNLQDWTCEVDDYQRKIGEEIMPLYGVKLLNDASNRDYNFIYFYYQYGVPQLNYPIPETINDYKLKTDTGYNVEVFIWSYDDVFLQVMFKDESLSNYSIQGRFDKDFYFDNENKIFEIINRVQVVKD